MSVNTRSGALTCLDCQSAMTRLALWAVATLLVISLSACGFKLRGSQALPASLDTVVINASQRHSALTRALSDRLPVYQLKSLRADEASLEALDESATVLLTLQPENLERRLLSVFSSGQVAEYEMIYSVDYQVTFPKSQTMSNTVVVSREFQDDPRQILAKSRELALIMDEMRDETADRIIRLLSSQYNVAQPARDSDMPSNDAD
ncbi:LPS assembly lipoprotein LptE [Ningiella sp. W23]|uniref:LPS-assembly lipoprotein LptE n=1 Tax=Ningiella sp. W23 TaxID=3023715 RepID=UPI003756355D